MINILILLFLFAMFKIFALVGNGYYTFRRVDRTDCYAQQESDKPIPHRIDDTDEDVTAQYMTYI